MTRSIIVEKEHLLVYKTATGMSQGAVGYAHSVLCYNPISQPGMMSMISERSFIELDARRLTQKVTM